MVASAPAVPDRLCPTSPEAEPYCSHSTVRRHRQGRRGFAHVLRPKWGPENLFRPGDARQTCDETGVGSAQFRGAGCQSNDAGVFGLAGLHSSDAGSREIPRLYLPVETLGVSRDLATRLGSSETRQVETLSCRCAS